MWFGTNEDSTELSQAWTGSTQFTVLMREPDIGYERVLGQLVKTKPDSKRPENCPVGTWRDVGPQKRHRILRKWLDEAQPIWNAARSAIGIGRYLKPEEADEAEEAFEALRASDIGELGRTPMLLPVISHQAPLNFQAEKIIIKLQVKFQAENIINKLLGEIQAANTIIVTTSLKAATYQ